MVRRMSAFAGALKQLEFDSGVVDALAASGISSTEALSLCTLAELSAFGIAGPAAEKLVQISRQTPLDEGFAAALAGSGVSHDDLQALQGARNPP